jgi:hypothetical protein
VTQFFGSQKNVINYFQRAEHHALTPESVILIDELMIDLSSPRSEPCTVTTPDYPHCLGRFRKSDTYRAVITHPTHSLRGCGGVGRLDVERLMKFRGQKKGSCIAHPRAGRPDL